MKKEIIVISLGGSLIVPEQIDVPFLKKFKKLILRRIKDGKRFIVICGGGKTCRNYINAAKKITKLGPEDLDWLGIHTTKLNAHLLRTIFREQANPKIIYDPNEKFSFPEPMLIAAGWKPGWSTDYDAVLLARNFGAKKILNLSNINHVYDRDPAKFKDAKPLEKISWTNFRKLLPKKWSPGLNSPFDPVASRTAEKLGLEVAIINGQNIKSLNDYLDGKKFSGTKIS